MPLTEEAPLVLRSLLREELKGELMPFRFEVVSSFDLSQNLA